MSLSLPAHIIKDAVSPPKNSFLHRSILAAAILAILRPLLNPTQGSPPPRTREAASWPLSPHPGVSQPYLSFLIFALPFPAAHPGWEARKSTNPDCSTYRVCTTCACSIHRAVNFSLHIEWLRGNDAEPVLSLYPFSGAEVLWLLESIQAYRGLS